MENKRLFFAFDVVSPWPEELPKGRILEEKNRHLTVAFLGEAPLQELIESLKTFPKPPFEIALAAIFDRLVFLPKNSERVAAWHVHFLEKEEEFLQFQKDLIHWLTSNGFHPEAGNPALKGRVFQKRTIWKGYEAPPKSPITIPGLKAWVHPKEQEGAFLSHVTIARSPFKVADWEEKFQKCPLFIQNLHLYESLGSSTYQSHWQLPILAPFEEKEHTADIAFTIRGKSLQDIHLHAELALSFQFPPLIKYFKERTFQNLEEIIASLNQIIAEADQKEGVSFKAVSYHGNLENQETLEWEMIVDV